MLKISYNYMNKGLQMAKDEKLAKPDSLEFRSHYFQKRRKKRKKANEEA